jgi:hypothetical protein
LNRPIIGYYSQKGILVLTSNPETRIIRAGEKRLDALSTSEKYREPESARSSHQVQEILISPTMEVHLQLELI